MRNILLFVLSLFICSLGCLGLDDRVRLEGAELAVLEGEISALERECDDLALEIAAATSPYALACRAEESGMVLAEPKDRAWLVDEEPNQGAEQEKTEEGDVFDVIGDVLRRGI